MPRSTDLHTYPREFEQLLRHAATTAVELDFPSTAKRTRFRHRFYSYLRAIRTTDQRPDLKKSADLVLVHVLEGTLKLRIGPNCDTWEGELLRAQLPQAVSMSSSGAPSVSSDAMAALQGKLKEIRARNEK